ncbi:hypothetical protein Pan161_58640 [Gimesia algae]|uniref:Uncharacterized protein n=1 Tax=Gimesia algae TaxID=2527971 RepID=A0A517VMC0_9PLAN|nr:hypothetical protein Pan161_58640 [Gimesia algae]
MFSSLMKTKLPQIENYVRPLNRVPIFQEWSHNVFIELVNATLAAVEALCVFPPDKVKRLSIWSDAAIFQCADV